MGWPCGWSIWSGAKTEDPTHPTDRGLGPLRFRDLPSFLFLTYLMDAVEPLDEDWGAVRGGVAVPVQARAGGELVPEGYPLLLHQHLWVCFVGGSVLGALAVQCQCTCPVRAPWLRY